jgi:hypothetical protein
MLSIASAPTRITRERHAQRLSPCPPSRSTAPPTVDRRRSTSGRVSSRVLCSMANFVTPAELGKELGHDDGDRPGLTVRRYLRERYPDHFHGQRWELTPEQADEVRRHFAVRWTERGA